MGCSLVRGDFKIFLRSAKKGKVVVTLANEFMVDYGGLMLNKQLFLQLWYQQEQNKIQQQYQQGQQKIQQQYQQQRQYQQPQYQQQQELLEKCQKEQQKLPEQYKQQQQQIPHQLRAMRSCREGIPHIALSTIYQNLRMIIHNSPFHRQIVNFDGLANVKLEDQPALAGEFNFQKPKNQNPILEKSIFYLYKTEFPEHGSLKWLNEKIEKNQVFVANNTNGPIWLVFMEDMTTPPKIKKFNTELVCQISLFFFF